MKKRASYGRIKETTIGGFVMPREYKHIKDYEKEIEELRKEGYSSREIGIKFGFSYKQMRNYFYRHNVEQRKIAAGVAIKRKGRPRKDGTGLPPSVQQLSKLTQLQYELAIKERHIKRLEMENELMRDFLSLTERK